MTENQINQEITADELQAASNFVGIVNSSIPENDRTNPMSQRTALKFLIARKFDFERALELYHQHEVIRLREGLSIIDVNNERFKAELQSGKFTISNHRDPNNSTIAIFTAKLHQPNKSSSRNQDDVHQYTLQGIVYQLDAALENLSTQRHGIVFIYNMNDSDFSNFDLELCEKILNLLKGAYPAKLKKVLVVAPPMWFKFAFQVLSVIVKKKLRERVQLLSLNQLQQHIPSGSLTTELGGTYIHDHQAWLRNCEQLHKNKHNDLCDPYFAQALVNNNNNNNLLTRLQHIEQNNSGDCTINGSINNDKDSISYDYGDSGLSLEQFVELIRSKKFSGLANEYESIVESDHKNKYSTFVACTNPRNMSKNRYVNVKCFDHTRVVLEPYDLPDDYDAYSSPDYINANYVDGYRQPKAYISTQGPTMHTLVDFWRMIWQTGSRVLVMLTLNVENEVLKCDRYWPVVDPENYINVPSITAGIYKVDFIYIERKPNYVVTCIKLTNTRSEVSRDVYHMQYTSWQDFGTPSSAALLDFRQLVLKKQLDAIELSGPSTYPPIVVHCSAGIGRSGTFLTIDICIQKLETTGLVDIKGVVEKLREQRYLSIQTKDQYVFCYKTVLEYGSVCGLIEDANDLNVQL